MDKAFMSQTKQIPLESWQETVWFLCCDPVGAPCPEARDQHCSGSQVCISGPPGSYKPIGLNKTNTESLWVTTVVHKSGTSAAIAFSDSHKDRFQGTESFQLYLSKLCKKKPQKTNQTKKKQLGGKKSPCGVMKQICLYWQVILYKGSYNCQGGTATVREK